MMARERIVSVMGAVLALVFQVLLSPHISVGFAVPNFLLVWCMVVAVARAGSVGPILPFILGLLYDLISGGPVGAMAFTATAISTLASALFRRMNNDTVFIAVFVLLVGMFLAEFVYGMFFLMFGYAAGFLEAFVYRIFPCFIYDTILAVILYFASSRFMQPEAPFTSEIRHLQ